MLKYFTLVTLALILSVTALGCSDMLNAQAAKDRDLGQMVHENLDTGQFRANFVSFGFAGEAGHYNCVCKDLNDAKSAGDFAYNIMVVLLERDNTKVKTGRDRFTIFGEQNGAEIFEVSYVLGTAPAITLKGPYAGEVYNPQFSGR